MYTGLRSNTAKLSSASTSTPKSEEQDQAKLLPGNSTNDDIINDSDDEVMVDINDTPKSPVKVTKLPPATTVQPALPPKALGQAIAPPGTPIPPASAPAPTTPATATKATFGPPAPSTPAPGTPATQAQRDTAKLSLQQALNKWSFNYYDPTVALDSDSLQEPIAKTLGTPEIATQEDNCQMFFEFLGANYSDVTILNADNECYTFVVHIPGTRLLKVCYGLGSGALFGGLGGSSINNYALALSGEYHPGVKFPSVISFPLNDIAEEINVKNPGIFDLFALNAALGTTKQPPSKLHFFTNKQATMTHPVFPIAPIPAYIVNDCIDSNIDVLMLLDRLQSIQQTDLDFNNTRCPDVYQHANYYCINTLVNSPKKATKVSFPLMWFTGQHVNADAEKWKQQRLLQHFPDIFTPQPTHTTQQVQPTATHTPTSATSATPTTATTTADAQLLQQLLIKQLSQPTPTKSDDNDKFLGMCESEYDKLLLMAHIDDDDAQKLPCFWHLMAQKNISKEGKKSNVRTALRTTVVKYREARIKITPALLTMIVNRSFEGKNSSSKQEATKGLSPFALPPISNAELDEITSIAADINAASLVSTSDIKRTKVTLIEAEDYDDLMRYLKEFANLLEVLFTQNCPLWIAIKDTVESLLDYTAEECAALSRASCNAILWIAMRQSRSFAAGEMRDADNTTPEFMEMMTCITVKKKIEFSGVPASMKKRAIETDNNNNNNNYNNNNQKRNKGNNNNGGYNNNNNNNGHNGNNNHNHHTNNNYNNNSNNNNNNRRPPPEFTDKGVQHPKLAEAFSTIKTINRVPPQIYKLCEACETKHHLLFPNRTNLCAKSQIFGLCPKECRHAHIRISDAEADAVIRKLRRAIEDPNQFRNQVNQSNN
jgi:hypothetical protein